MTRFLTFFLTLALLGTASYASYSAESAARTQTTSASWREEYAYTMGVAAMHYAYPYWRMAHVRYDWTQKLIPSPVSLVVPNKALNQFWNASRLTNADWQEGGGPNNDTLYSNAWVYVGDEPMILSVPNMDRFYSFQIVDPNSDNFAYVSELKHGRNAAHYAILPKGWKGKLPQGVQILVEAPSPWLMIAGRTYVANEQDLPKVTVLIQQYQLTPLSQWGQAEVVPPQPEVFKPYDKTFRAIDDPLAVWRTINHMLTENLPMENENSAMSLFREINVGPGLNIDELDEASKRGLARAAIEGFEQIKGAKAEGAGRNFYKSNGWLYSLTVGRTGLAGDFMLRTVHQSYGGLIGNDPEEALYYIVFTSEDGTSLNGKHQYKIHFPAGQLPEVKAFWSLTLYDAQANLVANSIDRYSIGDRTPGITYNEDGSLTIELQHEKPSSTNNWLPLPEGGFWLMMRAYQPGEDILKGKWKPPVISAVK